jgi:hypothetical protein
MKVNNKFWEELIACFRVELYVTIDGQSVSLSCNRAPIWSLRPNFYFCQSVADLFLWGALSNEKRVCRLQLLLVLASAVILRSESLGTRDHILLSQIQGFPFCRLLRISGLRWRYSTSPPHGRTIFLSLHIEHVIRHGSYRKHQSNSSVVMRVFIAAEMCLSSICLITLGGGGH